MSELRESSQPSIRGEVVLLLDQLLQRALEHRASDLHIEPKDRMVRVRLRVDGVMIEQRPVRQSYGAQLISRIKVLGQMDIAERRLPQDGTFTFMAKNNTPVAVRASTFPCIGGEKAVLRLLIGARVKALADLGATVRQVNTLRRLVQRPGGLILVTGPTGSGKTSTLYALLDQIDTERRNVVTLEDPIEVELPNITQGQVDPKSGFTFGLGLRSILRQDPDVILVGEMRDLETARIAVQASLTGHLVLSTLHTNSAADTMIRMIDMGLEPYVVANALVGVVAQRLVRTLCPACAELHETDPELIAEIGFEQAGLEQTLESAGCARCMTTGFKGRTAIYDVVPVDDDIRTVIKTAKAGPAVKRVLQQKNLPTLRRAGLDLVLAGLTTLEEVLRVT
ncbi:MAG: type II/IV secretion system protein [Oligoflexia bacterium]|nr:type II/IV secretion system protein [Oligoflexia bacterium]